MNPEWPLMTIQECAADEPYSTQIGPFGNNIRAEIYTEIGIPVLRGVNVKSGRFHDDDFVFINDEDAERLRIYECKTDDIITVHRGTIGRVGIIPPHPKYQKYILGNSMIRIRCDKRKVHPLFLFYWLSSPEGQDYFYRNISQVGVPALPHPLTTLRQASFRCPPIEAQKTVIRILGSLDDKIELNNNMNQTLEAIARAIFKSWFIDFDPVYAKMEGRKPYGKDEETAALFPDSFEDSELGEIPRGWQIANLDEEYSVIMGQSPPGETYNEDGKGMPFYQGRSDFDKRFPNRRVYCTSPKRMAQKYDTLITVRAPIGEVNMASEECCIGRGVAAVQHITGCISYTYYSINAIKEQFIMFEANGTVFGAMGKDDLSKIRVLKPSKEIIERFNKVVAPMDGMIEQNTKQSLTLSNLRDLLLPKLISGEIRIKPKGEIGAV